MNDNTTSISEEMLNFYVDGQLSDEARQQVDIAMHTDPSIRETINQIRECRDLVYQAYANTPIESDRANKNNEPTRGYKLAATALATLFVGIIFGWLAHGINIDQQTRQQVSTSISATEVFKYFRDRPAIDSAGVRKVMMHINQSEFQSVKSTLDEAELLLDHYARNGGTLQMEIIASQEGIQIFKPSNFNYVKTIERLIKQHDNLTVYACQKAIKAYEQQEGSLFVLPENIVNDRPSIEHISDRLDQGWIYIKT